MTNEETRDEQDDNDDGHRPSTFLHESDLRFAEQADPSVETRPKRSGRRDTLGEQSDSMIGETVTLSTDQAKVLGNFRLVSKLGSGGFGTVYKAEDLRLERFVAIKAALARPADRGDQHYKRVLHEGRAAAALDHPNIVSIYDVAELDGKPYIISQLIDGVTLKEWKASEGLTLDRTVAIMIQVARAVDYAHAKGVIHRDLKPGNILMDGDGNPYVNDFGIAKHSDAEETISHESSIIGTPAYMSPEQAAGHSREADRRSDLYSLGVILYELATGEKPFRGHSKMLIHHVIHTEPQPPRSLNQSVPRDLETVCLKCLEKDPDRRYQSCAELADELQRFLAGEPILARPISSFEHFLRRCRRHPTTTAVTAGLIAAIVLGLIGVSWQWRRAEASRREEALARIESEKARRDLAERVAFSNQMLHDAESKLAYNSMTAGDHRHAKRALPRLADLGDIEYKLIRNVERQFTEAFRHPELIRDLAISDDEQFVAAAGLRTLLVWDAATRQVVFRHREKGKQLRCVDFRPGTTQLVWAGQSGQLQTRVIGASGARTINKGHGAPINVVRFSNDGETIVSAGESGYIKTWTADDLNPIVSFQPVQVAINAVEFAGAERLLIGTAEGSVFEGDLATQSIERLTQSRGSILCIDMHDDGNRFAIGTRGSHILIGRLDQPEATRAFPSVHGPVLDVEFWESKNAIATTGIYGRMCVSKLADLKVRHVNCYFQGAGTFVLAKDSDRVLIGCGDGAVVSYVVDEMRPNEIQLRDAAVLDFAFTDKTLVVCQDSGPASVIEPSTGRLLRMLPDEEQFQGSSDTPPGAMTCIDVAPERSSLVMGTDDGRIVAWDSESGRLRMHGSPSNKPITRIQVSKDETFAITGGADGSLRIWDLSKADENESVVSLGGVIRGLAMSKDERRAAAVSASGSAVLIDLEARSVVKQIRAKQPLHSVAWSPDDSQIAVGGNRGTIQLYDRNLNETGLEIEAHNGSVVDATYAKSGNRLVTIGNDDHVTFSNLTTGRSGAVIEASHSASVKEMALSPDEGYLATGDTGGEVRLWTLKPIND